MNDIEPFESGTPDNKLTQTGVAAVGYLAAGAFLFIMNLLGARFFLLGLVLGGVSAVVGILALRSKDREDKKPGLILAAAGILELVSRAGLRSLRPFAGTLLSIGAVGLIAMGIWKGIQFLIGLKARS
jgi:hypothetical protein